MTNAASARCPFLAQLADMPRLTEARYEDGLGALYEGGANPADVAQHIFDQTGEMPNSAGLSTMFTTWGQFLDHDLSLTPEGHDEFMDDGLGHDIGRSEFKEGTGDDEPRVFQNAISWQIDANNVYGSSEARVEDVRSFEDGKLKVTDDPTSDRGLLPKANPDLIMAGELEGDNPVYLAGDIRANENPNLLAMHTLWVREHNYWAERLAEEHPDWDDQQLFEGAREIVEYEMQAITYNEWLPHLIGNVLPEVDDVVHDSSVDGEVAIEFSTAAFRFGHTLVSSQLERVNEDGSESEDGHLSMMDAFFNHNHVKEGGIDSLFRGQAQQSAQELDTKVIDDLNFFLATPDGVSGFSLVALNLLRGLDHGLQGYIDTRAELLGDIDPATLDPLDFSIITSDPVLQAELADVYEDVFQVDLWVGGLAEDKVAGTQSGPLFTFIISEQFGRTAEADETFGELDPALGADIIADVKASGMQDVILRNTDIDTMQADPFVVADRGLTENWEVIGTPFDDTIALMAQEIATGVHLLGGDDFLAMTGGTTVAENVDLGQGDDTIIASSGEIDGYLITDKEFGFVGHDVVDLSGTARVGMDIITRQGDDLVELSDVASVGDDILTGTGDDAVRLENKATVEDDIYTGSGDDVVELGARTSVDMIDAGIGADTVTVESGADVTHISGGEEGNVAQDNDAVVDTLSIQGPYRVEWQNGDPTTEAGTIFYLDENGDDTGETFTFDGFEAVTCFTRGTRIVTANGKTPIEQISEGTRVMTIDHGLQAVRWIGRRLVPAVGRFAPIEIMPGALGNTDRLVVSPQHRMLVSSAHTELMFGVEDVLAPAKALVNGTTIRRAEGGYVEYFHMLFDSHQIVLAEGIPSESFHPGTVALGALSDASREEVLALFPELAPSPEAYGPSARVSLKRKEAELLAEVVQRECNPE